MSALFRAALKAAVVGGLAVSGLAGCGSSGDRFAPACPRPSILSDASNLNRYRGSGRDFLDTTLQGRVVSINGSCRQDSKDFVAATVSVGIELTRGPAAAGRETDVPFFVAVTEGDRVLDKQVYTIRAVFPENTDRLRLSGDSVDLRLPVTETLHADAYRVTVGFQLTPAELEAARRGGR